MNSASHFQINGSFERLPECQMVFGRDHELHSFYKVPRFHILIWSLPLTVSFPFLFPSPCPWSSFRHRIPALDVRVCFPPPGLPCLSWPLSGIREERPCSSWLQCHWFKTRKRINHETRKKVPFLQIDPTPSRAYSVAGRTWAGFQSLLIPLAKCPLHSELYVHVYNQPVLYLQVQLICNVTPIKINIYGPPSFKKQSSDLASTRYSFIGFSLMTLFAYLIPDYSQESYWDSFIVFIYLHGWYHFLVASLRFAYLDVYFAFLALSTYLILIVPIPLVLMS